MNPARPCGWLILLAAAAVLLVNARAAAGLPGMPVDGAVAFSFSGQFIVTSSVEKSPLLRLPAGNTNADFLRLEPALLSVSAERLKQSLYRLLGIPSVRNWQGKIFLALHPALWPNENVTVVSRPIDQSWSYLVRLPNVVTADRYLRGMTGVLLLEFANRQGAADGHGAEIPDWLVYGLARQIQQEALADVMLSAPDRPLDDPAPLRSAATDQNLDPLAKARRVLRHHQALTYAELCWPTQAQLAGADGGVYQASAQLFVAELLHLDGGPAQLRRMLASLPQCYNWQTAFQAAFQNEFPRPLDIEKWWALTVVEFVSHAPGPSWTPGVSAGLLNQLLTVPVDVRVSSNSLPDHTEMTLQTVVRQFTVDRQSAIFQTHLRDLRLAQLRMSPEFIALTDGYCRVLAGYLGERLETAPRSVGTHHAAADPVRLTARQFVKQLDALDARRRTIEAAVPPNLVQSF